MTQLWWDRYAMATLSPTEMKSMVGLVGWCTDNNLTLNVKKTKEIIVDFRRPNEDPSP